MLNYYQLTLWVTSEQEEAIVDLFRDRQWNYPKTGHGRFSNTFHTDQETTTLAHTDNLGEVVSALHRNIYTDPVYRGQVSENFGEHLSYSDGSNQANENSSGASLDHSFTVVKSEIIDIDDEFGKSVEGNTDEKNDNSITDSEEQCQQSGGKEESLSNDLCTNNESNGSASNLESQIDTLDTKESAQHSSSDVDVSKAKEPGEPLRHNRNQHPKPLICENRGKYACDKCDKAYASEATLLYHYKYKHDAEYKKPFPCSVCGKVFTEGKLLTNHKRIHRDSKDFKCEQCGAAFKTAGVLWQHKKRHSKAYRYFCRICNKGFYEPQELRCHEFIHTGEKPFRCSVCEYSCAHRSNLRRHEKQHNT